MDISFRILIKMVSKMTREGKKIEKGRERK